ncbi:MAG: glycosyltransferase, partial [Acidimicrobiales bacterium]
MAHFLVVTNLYPPDARGGYEMACADVVRRWQAAGHAVTVLSGSGGDLPLTSLHEPPLSRWARIQAERRANQRLRAALAQAPDVVSVWNMAGLPLSLLTTLAESGLPVVYVLADAWPVRSPASDAWLARWRRLPPLAARLA